MSLTIMIPAYKEADNLAKLLPQIKQRLQELKVSSEIMIIDDIKTDEKTTLVCKKNGCRHINRVNGTLYGDAIRTGISQLRTQHVIIMDADCSHNPKYLPQFFALKNNYDLVIGSRYVEGGKTQNNYILIFMSLVVNVMYRIVLGLSIKDVSNSFRLYKTSDLKSLNLESDNFDIVEEILIKILVNHPNSKIKEIPIEFYKRAHGKSKRNLLKFILSYLATMIKLKQIQQKEKTIFRKNHKLNR